MNKEKIDKTKTKQNPVKILLQSVLMTLSFTVLKNLTSILKEEIHPGVCPN